VEVWHLDARTRGHVTVGLLGVPHFADIKINQFSPKIKSGSVAHLDARTQAHVTATKLGPFWCATLCRH